MITPSHVSATRVRSPERPSNAVGRGLNAAGTSGLQMKCDCDNAARGCASLSLFVKR